MQFLITANVYPSAPSIEHVMFHPTSNKLSWEYVHKGGLPLTTVLLERKANSSGYFKPLLGDTTAVVEQNFVIVSGDTLFAGEVYQFRVTASNSNGSSAPKTTIPQVALLGEFNILSTLSSSLMVQCHTFLSLFPDLLHPYLPLFHGFFFSTFSLNFLSSNSTIFPLTNSS